MRIISWLTSIVATFVTFWSMVFIIMKVAFKMNYVKFIRDLPSIMQLGLRAEICENTVAKLEDKIMKLENLLASIKCDCHKVKDAEKTKDESKDNEKIDFNSNDCPPPPPPPPPIIVENFKFAKSSTPIFLGIGEGFKKSKTNIHQQRRPDVIPDEEEQFLKRKKQKPLLKEDLIEQKKLLRKIKCPPEHMKCDRNPFDPNVTNHGQQDLNEILKAALKRKFSGIELNESTLTEDNFTDFSM